MTRNNTFPHSENVLQWIWKHLLFDISQLKTVDGKSVQIFDQGTLNTSNGPDFLNAKIAIDGIVWYGDVELHLQSNGWKNHNHHLDKAFNKVVLHVVIDHTNQSYYREDGGVLPLLNLSPFLKEGLDSFINNLYNTTFLPCASTISYISEDAFIKQIDKAHKEYLEKKGNDFLAFYNSELDPSIAWKHALVVSIFDGFGISHNRKPMQNVAQWFLRQESSELEYVTKCALEYAGIGDKLSSINWNLKGIYPANQPKIRIPQAIKLAIKVLETPFDEFLNDGVLNLWLGWTEELNLNNSSKSKILYATVYLPAVYVLGSIFYSQRITKIAFNEWDNYRTPIPKSIIKPFQSLGEIDSKLYENKLGTVHQLNEYCNSHRCHECFVLKKVILS